MGSINESSNKIVDSIAVIGGIAFPTNLLARNAAVAQFQPVSETASGHVVEPSLAGGASLAEPCADRVAAAVDENTPERRCSQGAARPVEDRHRGRLGRVLAPRRLQGRSYKGMAPGGCLSRGRIDFASPIAAGKSLPIVDEGECAALPGSSGNGVHSCTHARA